MLTYKHHFEAFLHALQHKAAHTWSGVYHFYTEGFGIWTFCSIFRFFFLLRLLVVYSDFILVPPRALDLNVDRDAFDFPFCMADGVYVCFGCLEDTFAYGVLRR